MSPFRSDQGHSDRAQKQKIETEAGNATQVGRDYTQTTHTRISLWISVVFVLVFAVAASVLVGLFGEHIPGVEVRIEESLPAELPNEVGDHQ